MKMARLSWQGIGADRKPHGVGILLGVLIALMAFAIACGGSSNGSSSSDSQFVQVIETDVVYTLDDLKAIGYKVSKTYDVTGLTDASEAYYGFWRRSASNDPTDYEVRIYPSHALAVSSGTAQVQEATGEDAVLDRTQSTWPEGIGDRRRVVGPGASQATGQPRYPDYVIFGNLVALCEGRNLEDAQDRCDDLVAALRSLGS